MFTHSLDTFICSLIGAYLNTTARLWQEEWEKWAISSSDHFYRSNIIIENLLLGFEYDGSQRRPSTRYVFLDLRQLVLKIYDGRRTFFIITLKSTVRIVQSLNKQGRYLYLEAEWNGDQNYVVISSFIFKRESF